MFIARHLFRELTRETKQFRGNIKHLSVRAQPKALEVNRIAVSVNDKDQILMLKDTTVNKEPLHFPGVWLRDNCLCEKCFHKDSLSRKPLRWYDFDVTVAIEDVQIDQDHNLVRIKWSDKHTSTFSMDWLQERDFSPEKQKSYIKEWYRPQSIHWGKADFPNILRKFDFQDVLHNDSALKEWLETLAVYGIAMLKNSPIDIGVIKSLANRVGFIRKTTYGEEFSVKSRPGAKNYSYLAEPLPLHTDLPYYEYKPSITLLHTLEQSQSSGGWNNIIDAFYIADQLKQNYPEHFQMLSETLVDWSDIGSDAGEAFHNIWRAPVINLDKNGNYTRINHSVPQRDTHFNISIDKILPWYKANALFVKMAYEQTVAFKTQPGDILTFNNLRMLHGRTGYDDTSENVRHIVGGFVDWDIAYSKIRVLKKAAQDALKDGPEKN